MGRSGNRRGTSALNGRRFTHLRTRSLAKVTLSLHVLGSRPDGYHEIDALTVAATAPYDEIGLSPIARPTTVAVTPKGAAPTLAATNLAARAIEGLRPFLPPDLVGVRIRLHKQIPMGAGLGGGSSNAAAVLARVGRHFRISARALERIAARLGSDVPFMVRGRPAHIRGRGEILVAAPETPELHLVIATPPFGCSTPAVYQAWDDLGGPTAARRVEAAALAVELRNDLEPAALHVAPRLAEFRDAFGRCAQSTPILLGSGSSWAILADDAAHAEAVAARARERLEIATVWPARSVTAGPMTARPAAEGH